MESSATQAIIFGLFALACLPWLLGPFVNRLMVRSIRRLRDLQPTSPKTWPKLSVVVPACNEADTIEPALGALLGQTYANLEIVLVDDRSTDGTGQIMERIAASDQRVRVVHVETLPDAWLGKVHALQRGLDQTDGEWVLFTDADVELNPNVLERTVAWSIEQQIDHLCIIPQLSTDSPIADLIITAALRSIALSQRPWRAEDPNKKEALGSGAFNLFRRSAFDQTPGLEWLKMEVADDLALGHMLKRHGFKGRVLAAPGEVCVQWYRSVRGAVLGLEKNAFAQIARFSMIRAIVIAAIATIVALAPFGALLVPVPGVWTLGAAALLAHLSSAYQLQRWAGISARSIVLSLPLGDLLLVLIVLRGSYLGWRRGGVTWRGTLYPTAALRAGVRIDF